MEKQVIELQLYKMPEKCFEVFDFISPYNIFPSVLIQL